MVPLPPGVRYEEQLAAVMLESAGALDLPGKEEAALAERIAAGIRPSGGDRYEPPLPSPYSLADDVEQYRAYVNQAVVPESFAGSPGAARLDAMSVAVSTRPEQSWRETQLHWRFLQMTDGPSRPTLEPRSNGSRERR